MNKISDIGNKEPCQSWILTDESLIILLQEGLQTNIRKQVQ